MTGPATRQAAKRIKPQPKRSRETRERLLEVAGQVFAEKGYERTTAKEIAKRAKINPAAINYYFSGVDELYIAVIEEARARAVTFEKLSASIAGIADPAGKLRAMLDFFVQLGTGPFASSWMARIFAREMVSPSPVINRISWLDTRKRLNLLREIVGEYLGLPSSHPDVAYVCWSLAAPLSVLLTADQKRFARIFPEVDLGPKGAARLSEHMAKFAFGGLRAIASEVWDETSARNGIGTKDEHTRGDVCDGRTVA